MDDTRNDLMGKRVLVIGLGRSGRSASRVLSELGACVIANDGKPIDELEIEAHALEEIGVELVTGGHPLSLLDTVDLVVTSPGVPRSNPLLVEATKRGITVWGELELAYRLSQAPFVAITGTKGKSTTSTLAGLILETEWNGRVVVAGNIGRPISDVVMSLNENDLIVAEVSSFQLETIVDFKPKVAAMLNISADHMDRHADMAEYVAAKARIFENHGEGDLAVANYDDPLVREVVRDLGISPVFFSLDVALDRGVFVRDGWIVAADDSGITEIMPTREVKLMGRHNLGNVLAAMAISRPLGITDDSARRIVQEFRGIPDALEFIAEIDGVRYINDTKATNIVSTKAALDAVPPGIILIMGGIDKGNDYSEIADLVSNKVKHVILLGPNVEKIKSALSRICPMTETADMREAVCMARSLAVAGDTVLLSPACASFDLFSNYKERGEKFKEAVNAIKAGR